ncbi:hypothetical protein N9W21_09240, partial [Shewanella sp.]|nr:hypothetical protein [Shewanella sp.]
MKSYSLQENIRQAHYLYSLNILGVSKDPTQQLQHWLKYRKLHSEFIKENKSSKIITDMNVTGLGKDKPETNLFFLFHQGFYFTIPYFMVKHYDYAGARFIMTKQSFDQTLAKQCATAFDTDFKPIIIDDKGLFVRELIKAKRQNYCIFLLTDLPFGYSGRSINFYETAFGTLKYRTGFMKIAQVLKQQPTLITSHVNNDFDSIHYNFTLINDTETLMAKLTQIYSQEYLTAERLDDLKKMCQFSNPVMDFKVEFECNNKKYRYYPATEK